MQARGDAGATTLFERPLLADANPLRVRYRPLPSLMRPAACTAKYQRRLHDTPTYTARPSPGVERAASSPLSS